MDDHPPTNSSSTADVVLNEEQQPPSPPPAEEDTTMNDAAADSSTHPTPRQVKASPAPEEEHDASPSALLAAADPSAPSSSSPADLLAAADPSAPLEDTTTIEEAQASSSPSPTTAKASSWSPTATANTAAPSPPQKDNDNDEETMEEGQEMEDGEVGGSSEEEGEIINNDDDDEAPQEEEEEPVDAEVAAAVPEQQPQDDDDDDDDMEEAATKDLAAVAMETMMAQDESSSVEEKEEEASANMEKQEGNDEEMPKEEPLTEKDASPPPKKMPEADEAAEAAEPMDTEEDYEDLPMEAAATANNEAAGIAEEEEEEEDEDEDEEEEEEETKQQEPSYVTRNRTLDERNEETLGAASELAGLAGVGGVASGADPLERLARDALGDLARGGGGVDKDGPVLGSSFLSETLTEEERRTRTRYLPQVEGMHILRKNEIKGDLALARMITSSSGVSTSLKKSKQRREENAETAAGGAADGGVAGAAGDDPSEDDRGSSDSAARPGTRTVDLGSTQSLVLPSTAFVAPPSSTGEGGKAKSGAAAAPTPKEVEAVTAYNPPRPPESVGPKKKHRLLRWERRPSDIEVDLGNYRKTVQKTREELRSAEIERNRIETVDNHLRRNYLTHLSCLNDEMTSLSDELAKVQQECVMAADLLTSRTRSRGAGKSSYVMRDVLTVLRTRGAEMKEKGIAFDDEKLAAQATAAAEQGDAQSSPGVGGVGARSIQDWDRSTVFSSDKVAQSWILPGNKVSSPCGEGTVLAVLPASELNVKAPVPAGVVLATAPNTGKDAMKVDEPAKEPSASENTKTKDAKAKKATASSYKAAIAPRLAVKLPFGIGFFNIDSVTSKEIPAAYSDANLASRWKGLLETATMFAGTVDVEALPAFLDKESTAISPNQSDGGSMDVDEPEGSTTEKENTGQSRKRRLVPANAGLVPTAQGRGSLLYNTSISDLDKVLDPPLFHASAVLGSKDNPAVPTLLRDKEEKREEYIRLKAKVLQLRNEFCRQHRIRLLNEKTYQATQDRSVRIEALVTEMRTDLKSLKSRLDDEARALGIDEEEEKRIFAAQYDHMEGDGSTSPFSKRARTRSHSDAMDVDSDEEDDVDEDGVEDEAAEESALDIDELPPRH